MFDVVLKPISHLHWVYCLIESTHEYFQLYFGFEEKYMYYYYEIKLNEIVSFQIYNWNKSLSRYDYIYISFYLFIYFFQIFTRVIFNFISFISIRGIRCGNIEQKFVSSNSMTLTYVCMHVCICIINTYMLSSFISMSKRELQ